MTETKKVIFLSWLFSYHWLNHFCLFCSLFIDHLHEVCGRGKIAALAPPAVHITFYIFSKDNLAIFVLVFEK